jgi:hypothetical protein
LARVETEGLVRDFHAIDEKYVDNKRNVTTSKGNSNIFATITAYNASSGDLSSAQQFTSLA